MLLIKKEAEFLQDKEKEIKLQVDEYLHEKKNAILSLERIKLRFESLSSSVENIEQDILKMENIIHQRKVEHVAFEQNVLYWQKKFDCARISLDSANKARDSKKKIIQELQDELNQTGNKLTELEETSETNTVELSSSQVYCCDIHKIYICRYL